MGGVFLIRNWFFALVLGVAMAGTASAQSDLVKRGDYLVNGILTCGNCHTPKGPAGDNMDAAFSGGLSWDEPPFKVTASNITQDKETGIGNYTDAELKQLLRKGIKRNGVPVAMVMPSGFYEVMTDRDLDAVIAYLRTIKPIKNVVPDPIYKMTQGHPIPPAEKARTRRRCWATSWAEDFTSPRLRTAWSATRRWGRVGGSLRASWALAASSSGTLGRLGVQEHHLEPDQGHRRLDR